MKVQDVMQTSVISVDENLLIKNVARLIFTSSAHHFPVVKGKKLVGFITEEDIYYAMYNASRKEYYDQETLNQLFDKQVKDLMVKNVISVTADTDLIEAQNILYEKTFAKLPVVDKSGNLLGLIARRDIFQHALEKQIPELEESQFASFLVKNYDQMINWEQRFDNEFPTLFRIFNRDHVNKVLDLGVVTGEYTIGLAKEGVNIVGVGHNSEMVNLCNEKREKLPTDVKKRVSFQLTDYQDLTKTFSQGSFDSVICMGGLLPYLPIEPATLLKSAHILLRKDGVFILQLLNLEKVMNKKKRFLRYKLKDSNRPNEKEELFVEFFDQKNETTLIRNTISFISDGKRWIFRGLNSVELAYIKNADVEGLFKKANFKNIVISGNKSENGDFGHMSLIKPFDPATSDWMTVFAKS